MVKDGEDFTGVTNNEIEKFMSFMSFIPLPGFYPRFSLSHTTPFQYCHAFPGKQQNCLFLNSCFDSQTSGLSSAIHSPPSVQSTLCYVRWYVLICERCLANIGFVWCYSLGSIQFTPLTLVYSVMLYVCGFSSQTSGLCSAIHSVPVLLARFVSYVHAVMFLYACTASQTWGFVLCYSPWEWL